MRKIVVPVLLAMAMAACAYTANTTRSGGHSEQTETFAGSWEHCGRNDSPNQCSRYRLLQRGKRICGTWSYFATYDEYEGKVIAEVIAPNEARRVRICGRPGGKVHTECDVGWDTVNLPLRLCDGKLGDLDGKGGSCFADFERVKRPDPSLEALAAQPWVEECLSGKQVSGQ